MTDRNSPTRELEAAVAEFYDHFPYPSPNDFALKYCESFSRLSNHAFGKEPSLWLLAAIGAVAESIYESEAPYGINGEKFVPEKHTDPVAHGRYRDALLRIVKF